MLDSDLLICGRTQNTCRGGGGGRREMRPCSFAGALRFKQGKGGEKMKSWASTCFGARLGDEYAQAGIRGAEQTKSRFNQEGDSFNEGGRLTHLTQALKKEEGSLRARCQGGPQPKQGG